MAEKKRDPNVLSDEELNLKDFVLRRYSAMRDARVAFETEWEDNERSFIAPFRSNDQYSSDINLPVEFSHVQHALSEVMDSPPKMVFSPKNKRGVEKLDIAQSTWDFAWEKADTDRQIFWLYASIFTNGTGVWFEGYSKVIRKSYKKIGLNKEDMQRLNFPEEFLDDTSYVEEDVVEYDDIYGEWVPNKEFYIDENAKTFWEPTHAKDARDCIRRRFYSQSAFHEAWAKYDRHVDVVGTMQDNETYRNSEEAKRETGSEDLIEVLEYWNRETQLYVVVVNREFILNGENGERLPYAHGRLPFVMCACFPMPNSPWGLGLVGLLRGIRAQQDVILNIGMDHGKNAIQPPLMKASNMEVMDEEWYAGMGYILNINGSLDDIKELPVGELSNNFFTLLDRLENYEVLATGADVRSLIKSEPTAFQQANKKEISLKRLKVILQFINWDGLRQMAEIRYANIREVYGMDDIEKISGEDVNMDGIVTQPEGRQIRVKNKQVVEKMSQETGELEGLKFLPADGHTDFFILDARDLEDYDISIDFKLNTSKELKKLRFQEAMNVLPQILEVGQVNVINLMELLEFWADTYDIPQTIINKQRDVMSTQRPLGVPPPEAGAQPGPGLPQQMSPQGGSNPAEAINQLAQQGFNINRQSS